MCSFVEYSDQQTGAPHTVCCSKSFVFTFKQVFSYFSITNGKKKEKRKAVQTYAKTCNKTTLISICDFYREYNAIQLDKSQIRFLGFELET